MPPRFIVADVAGTLFCPRLLLYSCRAVIFSSSMYFVRFVSLRAAFAPPSHTYSSRRKGSTAANHIMPRVQAAHLLFHFIKRRDFSQGRVRASRHLHPATDRPPSLGVFIDADIDHRAAQIGVCRMTDYEPTTPTGDEKPFRSPRGGTR